MTKRVTITDVANRAGVSKMTVSRVINQKGEISETTRLKILDAMETLGYRPNRIARSLATNTTLRIGIIVPSLANPYFGEIVEGAESIFWENGYHILLAHTDARLDREQAAIEIFEDHRVDGVLVLSSHSPEAAMNQYLQHCAAVVTLNTHIQPGIAGRIYTDEIQSTTLAIQHLVQNGRKNLGYVHFDIGTYANQERYRGFENAVKQAGLPFDPAKQTCSHRYNGEQMIETIYEMLQNTPQMDGIVCFNTGIAARALQACTRAERRVPDDIAIIGYDDSFMSQMITPALTVIELMTPKREVGAMAAKLVLERIEGTDLKQDDIILQYKLIVRDSAP